MADPKQLQKIVYESTKLEEKVKACVQKRCEPLKNQALALLYKTDENQFEEGSVEWLNATLPQLS